MGWLSKNHNNAGYRNFLQRHQGRGIYWLNLFAAVVCGFLTWAASTRSLPLPKATDKSFILSNDSINFDSTR